MMSKITKLLTLLAVIGVCISCAPGAGNNQEQNNQQMTKDTLDVAEVEATVESFRQALVAADEAALTNLTAKELTYGHSGGLIEDQATFINSMVSKKFVFTSLDFSDITIAVIGNTAVVRHSLFAHTADQGKDPGTVSLHVLLVWEKIDGQLKLIARQAVKVAQ